MLVCCSNVQFWWVSKSYRVCTFCVLYVIPFHHTFCWLCLQEIEDKAPQLKKQREDYETALQTLDQLTPQLDAAMLVTISLQ